MRQFSLWRAPTGAGVGFLVILASLAPVRASAAELAKGKPELQSMSALAFGPDGVLFVGDAKAGAVVAIALADTEAPKEDGTVGVKDIEGTIGALLGTTADEIMIHDMAVNPISQSTYLAVSRGRGKWKTRWELPNDLADADILLRVDRAGEIEEVILDDVEFASINLPNPVAADKTHSWKEGISLRGDAITDMAYAGGMLYVAGLSNEEFASTMWQIPYPFEQGASATTLEIFHGAHGEYETHAPIRAFVPYELKGKSHLLAAYLCTPLVVFPTADLTDGAHVKGRTVGEFGAGNYPLDMIVYQKGDEERLLIANSNLPFMIVKPGDIEAYEGSITQPVEKYLAGVEYELRSGTGIQQMDRLNADHIIALHRQPGGTLDLVSVPTRWF